MLDDARRAGGGPTARICLEFALFVIFWSIVVGLLLGIAQWIGGLAVSAPGALAFATILAASSTGAHFGERTESYPRNRFLWSAAALMSLVWLAIWSAMYFLLFAMSYEEPNFTHAWREFEVRPYLTLAGTYGAIALIVVRLVFAEASRRTFREIEKRIEDVF